MCFATCSVARYVCMCAPVPTHVHTHGAWLCARQSTHTHMCTCAVSYMSVRVYICPCVGPCVHVHACLSTVSVHVCNMCRHVYMHMCVTMHTCTPGHTWVHTHVENVRVSAVQSGVSMRLRTRPHYSLACLILGLQRGLRPSRG